MMAGATGGPGSGNAGMMGMSGGGGSPRMMGAASVGWAAWAVG